MSRTKQRGVGEDAARDVLGGLARERGPEAERLPFHTLKAEDIRRYLPKLGDVEEIGRGRMGVVFRARRRRGGDVAVKVMAPALLPDARWRERFRREARALAKLRHKNIVRFVDHQEHDGHQFLIMEYVDGPTLREVLSIKRRLPRSEALGVVVRVCRALHHAHERGLIHRDVKPENVMLHEADVVKLTDFGLVRARVKLEGDPTLTATGEILGTPYYMAPEMHQLPSEQLDARVDVYAAGVVLRDLLTGKLPSRTEARTPPEEPLGDDVEAVLVKALARDRRDRYPTALDMQVALDGLMRGARIDDRSAR